MDDKKREKWKVILWSRYWGAAKHNRKSCKKKEAEVSYLGITKDTTMGEMLEYDRGIAYILMQSGMHCVGCPSSIHESLEEACAVHGLNTDSVLNSSQEYLLSRAG